MQAALPESERLRLLGIMGVDVYVPRIAPLARATEVASAPAQVPATSLAARVLVRGVGADARPRLLAAVLRGARLQSQDWSLAPGSGGALPEWRFGQVEGAGVTPPALALPSLAELRESVSARRDAWRLLRSWLRRA